MRYIIYSDMGGLLWWLLIRFCKTKLKDEQANDKWSRNVFFLCAIMYIIMFIYVKFF
jgi:hypothetical protein